MNRISYSMLIGLVLGLSVIIGCFVAATNTAENNEILSPQTIGAGVVKENIQKFTGVSDEIITYRGIMEFPSGNVFDVTTKTGRFYVNTRTGEVESAIIPNGISMSSITAGDLKGMTAQAESFARKHYPNFTRKAMVLADSQVLDHGDAGKEYLFIWNEMAGEAFTPSVVMISVFPDHDNTIAWTGIDRPLMVDTKPKVTQTRAQEIVLRTFSLHSTAKVQTKLVVVQDRDLQKLVWIAEAFELDSDRVGHGGTVFIAADSGDVLSTYPI